MDFDSFTVVDLRPSVISPGCNQWQCTSSVSGQRLEASHILPDLELPDS